jgi:transcriptional regulator with XRE-family HTH domain
LAGSHHGAISALARGCGIAVPNARKILRGETLPSLPTFIRICEYLEVEPSVLLNYPGNRVALLEAEIGRLKAKLVAAEVKRDRYKDLYFRAEGIDIRAPSRSLKDKILSDDP